MEENYIQIFCTTIAYLLKDDLISEDDMKFLIIEFSQAAANIHTRDNLIAFIEKYPQYSQLQPLVSFLRDPNYKFTFLEE